MYRSRTSNYDGDERGILWTAAPPEIAELSRDTMGQLRLWTPAPHLRSRWRFWNDTFGDAEAVLKVMKFRWIEKGADGNGVGGGRVKLGDGLKPRSTTRFPEVWELDRFLSVMKSLETVDQTANQ